MNDNDHSLDELLAASPSDDDRQRLAELWNDLGRLPAIELPTGMVERFAWNLRTESVPTRPGRSRWTAVAASFVIGLLGGAAVVSLIGQAGRPDPQNRLRAAAIVATVPTPSSAQRLAAIHALGDLMRTDPEARSALLKRVLIDPTPAVQLAAIDHLANLELSTTETELLARALPELGSPIVQVALLDLLTTRDGPAVTAAVERLQRDRSADALVRRHAGRALSRMIERTSI